MLKNLIEDFNRFFKGKAKVVIVNGWLEITIGSLTMLISLPEYVGGRNDPIV